MINLTEGQRHKLDELIDHYTSGLFKEIYEDECKDVKNSLEIVLLEQAMYGFFLGAINGDDIKGTVTVLGILQEVLEAMRELKKH
jgi:hypothetical protein